MLTPSQFRIVLKILRKEYGNRSTALTFNNPFQLLISTILSAQSTDKQVNKITDGLFKQYSDARSFLRLGKRELEKRIKSIGLYKNKANHIYQTCKILVNHYQGEVPESLEELIQLPGVGRKTANVVLSVGFKKDAIAVDTHVFRVANRLGLAEADNPQKTELQLMKNIPQKDWSAAHHWLIWHGRMICKAKNPNCQACPLKKYCQYVNTPISVIK